MTGVDWIRGLPCVQVTFECDTWEWVFLFGTGVVLRIAAPWRILTDGRIALGHDDHGQQFGLAQPLDGPAVALDLLRDRPVSRFTVTEVTGDAAIDCSGGRVLQIFNSSSGFEGWTLSGTGGRQVVAQGGGSVVVFPGSTP
jgi:hypothetical protein